MRKNALPLIILAAGILASPSYGAPKSLPMVEILGKKYYVYTSKKGDTLFGIAREQQWDDATLQQLNSRVIFPLKKGVRLYYPVDLEVTGSLETSQMTSSPVSPLTHIVSKGESIYGIAKRYNMSVEDLYILNPQSRNGIHNGQELILKRTDHPSGTEKKNGESGYHTLRENENLSQLAGQYDVSVSSIMAVNPGINPSRINVGETIKIPEKGSGLKEVVKRIEVPVLENFDSYIVESNDNWKSISEKTGVNESILEQANPSVKTLKKKQVLTVPKINTVEEEKTVVERDERELTSVGIKAIYNDIHKISVSPQNTTNVRIAILAECPDSKKDLEFIRGFLTGVDKIKDGNFKLNLKVIDASDKADVISEQLSSFNPNLVFYTGDKNLPEFILKYATSSLTPIVNTFDVRNEDYLHNPYIIQLLSPSSLFNENIANNIYNKFGDYKLIMVGEEDATDQLASYLKKLWNAKRVKNYTNGEIDKDYFIEKDKYLFYTYSVKKTDIEKLLKEIIEIQDVSPLSDIVTLGRPNWVLYDSALADDLHKVNAYIPSRFYMNDKATDVKIFNNAYESLFGRAPVKSLPLYAAVGYDMAKYFIPAMASSGNDINQLRPSEGTIQSEIDLKRVSNWSGFINPPVYLVNFTPYDTIDKIIIE